MLTLILGSALAVAALAYVLMPLLRGGPAAARVATAPEAARAFSAVGALREIEFDRETGKLSDADYVSLSATYTPVALQELRELAAHERAAGEASAQVATDPAEELIAFVKANSPVCPSCGPRPETDALFCSECGATLAA